MDSGLGKGLGWAARAEDSTGHREEDRQGHCVASLEGRAGPAGCEEEYEHACVGEDPGCGKWTWSGVLHGLGWWTAGRGREDRRSEAWALGEQNLSWPLSLPTGDWVKLAAMLTVVKSGESQEQSEGLAWV